MEEHKIDNWIDAMIERFKNSAKNVSNESLFLSNENKIKLVKEIDFEAFKTLFLLVIDGVLDIDITINRGDIRKTKEYSDWHKEVLKRDKWNCQNCGSNKKLEVHHIKPIKFYSELATDIDNGLTLCHNCHKETDSYGYKVIYKYGR